MSQLAVHGGKPVCPKSKPWPQWPIHDEADIKLLASITRTNRWSYDGPIEWKFADAFNAYHKSKWGMCCANGTVAIQLAFEALGIGAYDEVIVPAMTWQATAAAVLDVNAVPVLVDVEPDTWCLDAAKAEAAITKKTKAIIVVHLYGCVPDMTKIKALCKKRNLFLIEDCAHQHGTFIKGKGVGTLGHIGCFSFQESKVLSSGEGGFNMCQDKTLFERLYSLRNCGRGYMGDYTNAIQSGNYRLTEWQAAILLGGLKRLDKQVKLRDKNAIYLNGLLAQIPGIIPMRRRKEVDQQSYFNFAFRLDFAAMGAKGISNAQFSAALAAETGLEFEPPYEPLTQCSLYKPHTKPRYRISAEYWKQINPRRWKAPVCEDAHYNTGIAVHHRMLMGSKHDMDDIATAVAKVVANIDEVRTAPKTQRRARGLAAGTK
ncbi:MAG TPA: DegT/DnrJ/EryC1/StrS family aminotransferase [Candidatus Hydrogenedentes bacterium]|nr:DegT/DnrJ/EryC1/StrS family aminotransferase [Candidatus Hydrogenedentota bacterium]HOS03518.1 DegT/DnrJ/EryC1/StrS family aminotransferase [Candidatus Hydrogenedentota bacterium]